MAMGEAGGFGAAQRPSSGLSLTDRSSPTQGARDQTKRPPVSAGGRFAIRYLDALEVARVVSRVLGQLIGLVGQLERPGGLILRLLRVLVCLLRVFLSLLFWVVRAQARRKSVVADRSCVQAWGRVMQRAHAYGESSCRGPHRRNPCDHADSPRPVRWPAHHDHHAHVDSSPSTFAHEPVK
jgi:hypothetical protein